MLKQDISIVIYSIEGCKYCEMAKSLLKSKEILFIEYFIQSSEEREQLKKLYPFAKTFPVVIINKEWIGGYTQLSDWLRNAEF